MPSALDPLVEIIHSGALESWKQRNEEALTALFGTRYPKRAENVIKLRAPGMQGSDSGVPYAAYIHPSNPDSGPYGGMSFVIFPVEGEASLIALVIGTQGLAPDEAVLGRPGHARKVQAIAKWLNHSFGKGDQVAWAKQDPTRTDIDVPESIQRAWSAYNRIFERYGRVLYGVYRPTEDREGTVAAAAAMLDLLFEERGHAPLKGFEQDSAEIQSAWFSYLMPRTESRDVVKLLASRKFVILQGPPGTGKTRMARQILAAEYGGRGRSVQFHPSTTYENFIGGLAPQQTDANGNQNLGFRFSPKRGYLIEAAVEAARLQQPYLLHIDEINRADLAKVLGEAIYLLEPTPESPREIDLPYDFDPPIGTRFRLPDNLHLLGTMNTADRSIAIVDVAVRRRFAFLPFWPDYAVVERHGCDLGKTAYQRLLSIFVEHATDDALALMPGHSYFLGPEPDQVRIQLRSNLVPLLDEYLAQGYVGGFAESIRGYNQWLDSL